MNKLKISSMAICLCLALIGYKRCSPPLNEPSAHEPRVSISESQANKLSQAKKWAPSHDEQKEIDSTLAKFYGKVIDEIGQVVPNAKVVIEPNNDPWVSNLRRRITLTDINGLFYIEEQNAPSMRISVSASGYYTTSESSSSFGFALLPVSAPTEIRQNWQGVCETSKDNPHIFKLKRILNREPLLEQSYVGILKSEQSYQIGLDSSQRIHLKYWHDPKMSRIHANEWPVHDWGVELSVEGGGLIETKPPSNLEPDSFIAPLEGYKQSVRFSFSSELDDSVFRRDVVATFFVKFANETFARVSVDIESSPTRPFGKIRSWFNPSGNRSTEFDPAIKLEKQK